MGEISFMGKRSCFALVLTVAVLFFSCGVRAAQGYETGGTFAVITKSSGNAYNEKIVEGFTSVIEEAGGNSTVRASVTADAESQEVLIRSLLLEGVDCIAIAAVDAEILSPVLEEAKEQGVLILSFDSALKPENRLVHVSDVDSTMLARTLMDAVYGLTEGDGEWAILSTSEHAPNQSEWISEMEKVMSEEKYGKMKLVKVCYGEDNADLSAEETEKLLDEFPKLKAICALTTVGLHAACPIVEKRELTERVRLTGLGLPSEMYEHIGNGKSYSCDYMYLWNPTDVGRITAYTALQLYDRRISGAEGEHIETNDMGEYFITEAKDGGTQIITGPPFKFDASNIKDWISLF